MKILLFLAFIVIGHFVSAQTNFTTGKRLNILEMKVSYTSANLIKCHNQFKTGNSFFLEELLYKDCGLGLLQIIMEA